MKLRGKVKSYLIVSLFALSIGSIFGTTQAWADIAVIVNPDTGVSSLSESEVKKLFLGKKKKFPNGSSAIPVDQREGSSVNSTFSSKVLGKSDSQLKAYWSKLIFSGKGTPPRSLDSDSAVKSFVAGNKGAIGYISSGSVDGSVKSVLTIK